MTVKKKPKEPPYVQVPLWWAEAAAKATEPAMLVCVRLLYMAWKAKSMTFPLANKYLEKNGVSREIKRRVLRDLEDAGLITVERRHGKTPTVTLVVL